jgi:hypothetical protein
MGTGYLESTVVALSKKSTVRKWVVNANARSADGEAILAQYASEEVRFTGGESTTAEISVIFAHCTDSHGSLCR